MGTIPFVVDMGARKIYLADEGSLHAQLLSVLGGNLVGPIERGFLDVYSGEVETYMIDDPDEAEAIAKAVLEYTGRGRGPVMSRKRDPDVCPLCDELLSECQCLSWGEGAEWADEPIDQSSLREMKPGIQASQKTAMTAYHVAPSEVRDSIRQDGLTGEQRGYDDEDLPIIWNYNWDQPSGNYLFPNLGDAYAYVRALRQNSRVNPYDQFDIYEVNVDGLPLYVDPEPQLTGSGPSNLGEAWEVAQAAKGGEWDPNDSEPGYMEEFAGSPARIVTPVRISPERLRIHDANVPEGEDAATVIDEMQEFNEMNDPWSRMPMTEIPWPGHESKLTPQQKAAAWDKPSDRLSEAEAAYISARSRA
jgi:hypothetical protein